MLWMKVRAVMQQEAEFLRDVLRRLQSVGNGFGSHGTFRIRLLLGMLLHEVAGQIERCEAYEKARCQPGGS